MLEKEFDFFVKNQDELFKKYDNKILVIKDEKVIGVYDSEKEAFLETSKNHEIGTFLIQACGSDPSVYTQTFHSRAFL